MISYRQITQEKWVVQLAKLYHEANFLSTEDSADFLKTAMKNSLILGAFDADKLVGTARAISDFVSDAYIQDVTVDKEYRGRGIGAELIKQLVKMLEAKGVDWIGLVGVPNSESFYKKLNFQPLCGHTAYRLIKGEDHE